MNQIVSLTESATRRIFKIIAEEIHKRQIVGMRFGLKAGGCSGFEYILKPIGIDEEVAEDAVININGIRISIDKRSLELVRGTEIDYSLLGFSFKNPNAKSSCGCGQSFEPK